MLAHTILNKSIRTSSKIFKKKKTHQNRKTNNKGKLKHRRHWLFLSKFVKIKSKSDYSQQSFIENTTKKTNKFENEGGWGKVWSWVGVSAHQMQILRTWSGGATDPCGCRTWKLKYYILKEIEKSIFSEIEFDYFGPVIEFCIFSGFYGNLYCFFYDFLELNSSWTKIMISCKFLSILKIKFCRCIKMIDSSNFIFSPASKVSLELFGVGMLLDGGEDVRVHRLLVSFPLLVHLENSIIYFWKSFFSEFYFSRLKIYF